LEKLTSPADFKRVRQLGKSYPHALLVMVCLPNENEKTRVGISAGKAVGNAVERNRAKRLLRAALFSLHSQPDLIVSTGWDVVIHARRPIIETKTATVHSALEALFRRANLFMDEHGPL
jgi:ribonuclease P protein component